MEPLEALPSQPSTLRDADAVLLVEFEDGDPHNPLNFPTAKKWVITVTACSFTGIAGAAISSYTMGVPSMVDDLNCSTFAATVGLGVYPIGFGLVPLFTTSLSEEFGRFRIYIASSFFFMLTHVMAALAPNIQTVIVARFLGGSFGSTSATLVGGTIADIWRPNERGFPMALFAIAALGSTGLGPLFAGWTESNNHLGWRWIQWLSAIVGGICFCSILLFLTETRADVILTRLAHSIRKNNRDDRYHARAEIDKPSLFTLIKISSTRPISLLFTEPIVLSISLWIGFVWGVLFCFLDSISGEMESIYNFTIGERGTTYICITIGSVLGLVANMHQEVLYKKYADKKGPEARVYLALVASVLLPAGMLTYAWAARPSIHWIVPLIGLTVFILGVFIIYQFVFVYLADCYGTYASSALAGQSMCRNLLGAVFPLFAQHMYDSLTYEWANTLFALISVAMVPIPFVLFIYGAAIRKRSKVSRKLLELADMEEELEGEGGKNSAFERERGREKDDRA